MKRISSTLFLVLSAILCFGQNKFTGTWILDSYVVDRVHVLEIDRKLEKAKMSFNEDGHYIKTYFTSNVPDSVRLKLSRNLLDKKTIVNYYDSRGHELKSVRIRKKKENGTYQNTGQPDEIRFIAKKLSYTKKLRVEGPYLIIADSLNGSVVWSRYKKKV